jgi:hypothetical protein
MSLFSINGEATGTNPNLLHSMAKALKSLRNIKACDLSVQKNVLRFSVNRSLIKARMSNIDEAQLRFKKLENGFVTIEYSVKIRWVTTVLIPALLVFCLWSLMGHSVRSSLLVLGAFIFISAIIGVIQVKSWIQTLVE